MYNFEGSRVHVVEFISEIQNFSYSSHKNKFEVENTLSSSGGVKLINSEFNGIFIILKLWKLKFEVLKINFKVNMVRHKYF